MFLPQKNYMRMGFASTLFGQMGQWVGKDPPPLPLPAQGMSDDRKVLLSCAQLSVTSWTVAHQAPLSTGLSRQEYQSCHFLLQGIFLTRVGSLGQEGSAHIAGRLFTI